MDLGQIIALGNGAMILGFGTYMVVKRKRAGNEITAVLPLTGSIVSNNTPGKISSKKVIGTLEGLIKNKKIKGIIFDINSGGGVVYQSREIAEYIEHKVKIPTVALARDVCASGAYMIACATDSIIAREESAVGSIGVITAHFAAGGLLEKLGVKYQITKAGKNKDSHMPFNELTPEQEEITRGQINTIYDIFVDYVQRRREGTLGGKIFTNEGHLNRLATGDIFFGKEAFRSGLIDHIGSLDKAVEVLEEIGNFKHSFLYHVPERMGLLQSMGFRAGTSIGSGIANGIISSISEQNKTTY